EYTSSNPVKASAGSIQQGNSAAGEIVKASDNFQQVLLDLRGEDRGGLPQQSRLDPRIGLDRSVEVGAGLVDCRPNIGIKAADLPRYRLRFDRGLDRPAIGMAQHHDGLRTQYCGTI